MLRGSVASLRVLGLVRTTAGACGNGAAPGSATKVAFVSGQLGSDRSGAITTPSARFGATKVASTKGPLVPTYFQRALGCSIAAEPVGPCSKLPQKPQRKRKCGLT